MGFNRIWKDLHGNLPTWLNAGEISYVDKLLALNPWRLYPFWDVFGSATIEELVVGDTATVVDLDDPKGIILGQPGIDDNTCILYNKSGLVSNTIHVEHATAAFIAGFPLNEGTICTWAKMYNAGIWTDGQNHVLLHAPNASGHFAKFKAAAAPRLQVRRGTTCLVDLPDQNDAAWFHVTLKYSVTHDVVSKYHNGVWVGDSPCPTIIAYPALTNCWSGAWTGNSSHFKGYEQYLTIFSRLLTDPEILEVATL